MYDNYFSNFGRPPFSDDICKDSATSHPRFWRIRFLNVFSHTNAYGSKFDLAVKKGQMSMFDHYFSNFGRPPVPDDLCKDSAPKHPRF